MVRAIRGAVQIERDEKSLVASGVVEMIEKIVTENKIEIEDIVSIFFTVTGDITSINPAAALRADSGYEDTPLFCAQEPETTGSMPRVVRVLVTCNNFDKTKKAKHVYLNGAERLRPDLS